MLITDQNAGRTLDLQMKDKKAVLKSLQNSRGDRGPFAWVGDELRTRKLSDLTRVKSLSLQGPAEVDGASVNVVRVILQDVELGKTMQQPRAEHDLARAAIEECAAHGACRPSNTERARRSG